MNHLTTHDNSKPLDIRLGEEIRARDADGVERQLAALMVTFRDRAGDEDAKTILRAYRMALSDLSSVAVIRAIERFARGKVDRNHAFAPSSAEIHFEAERIEAEMREAQRIHERARLAPRVQYEALPAPTPLATAKMTVGPNGGKLVEWKDIPTDVRPIGRSETPAAAAKRRPIVEKTWDQIGEAVGQVSAAKLDASPELLSVLTTQKDTAA